MENSFSTSITTSLTPQEALKKVSNVPEWWGVSFEGKAAEAGDNFVIRMGGDSFFNMSVSESVRGKKLAWLVTDCNMPWYKDRKEWANTTLLFEAQEDNGATLLSFTHEGLTPAAECYNDCAPGWTHWIATSLSSYLNTGKGVFRAPTK